MASALRQLATKWSAPQVALLAKGLSSSGGLVVREKMSEEEITRRCFRNLSKKLDAELNVLPDGSFYNIDEPCLSATANYGELKSVLKDLRKFNRKNGVVPDPAPLQLPPPRRRVSGGVNIFRQRKLSTDDEGVVETAVIALEKYKKKLRKKKISSSFEFVSVLSVEAVELPIHIGEYYILIQACDLSAARASIKLLAHCSVPRRFRRVYYVDLDPPSSLHGSAPQG